jgi:AraC-like DNA-binding protein
LAKIAAELHQALRQRSTNGSAASLVSRIVFEGDGWTVADVMCTSGPNDPMFEERHERFSIALVTAGSFQYRSAQGCELMTPGSLLLGSAEQSFECGHEHGSGDRCVAFWYAPEYFERIAIDAGLRGGSLNFGVLRLPPLRSLSSLAARASAGIAGAADVSWEELHVDVAAQVVQAARDVRPSGASIPAHSLARVTRVVRMIERQQDEAVRLEDLAREARLSPYHFLRTFERLTGLTPHQYVRRMRLREAATRLLRDRMKILDVALDSGFGDISNFNRAFRNEFGASPRAYRERRPTTVDSRSCSSSSPDAPPCATPAPAR